MITAVTVSMDGQDDTVKLVSSLIALHLSNFSLPNLDKYQ